MKKKIIIILVVGFFVCTAILTAYTVVEKMYIFMTLMICLYCVTLLSVIGLINYRKFMSERVIDPKKNLKRNYKRIYLGIMNGDIADENTLDLRGYHRNFYVDSLLVQRYYSFLAKDGTIIIFSGKDIHYVNDNKISMLDYPLLHPVTLMEHGIKPQKYLFYNPLIGLVFVFALLRCNRKKAISDPKVNMDDIQDFCRQREVEIRIIESW